MSGFFGASNAAVSPAVLGYHVQTSVYGTGITILVGTQRTAGNVLWVGDWNTNASPPSGGKGASGKGSSGGKGSGTFNYSASFIIGCCQGPVMQVLSGWQDKTQLEGTSVWTVFVLGEIGQTPWGFLLSNHYGQALSYSEIAYAGFENSFLATSGTIPNYSFEIQGPGCFLPLNWLDSLVPDAIFYLLTNFNCANWPASWIGDLTQVRQYCLANQLNVSPLLDAQDSAQSIIQELLLVCNSDAFWGEGQLKIVTYGDKAVTSGNYTPPGGWGSGATGSVLTLGPGFIVTGIIQLTGGSGYLIPPIVTITSLGGGGGSGATAICILANGVGATSVLKTIVTNPGSGYTTGATVTYTPQSGTGTVTFTPNVTPQFNLTYADFIAEQGKNPVTFTIEPGQDATNYVLFEWTNRARQYNLETAYAEDADAVANYGLNIGSVQTVHSVCNANVVNQITSIQLKRSVYMLRKAQFTLGWSKSALEPMDIVTVPEQGTGVNLGVRILKIEEDDKGNLACEGEVLLFPILNAALNPSQVAGGYTPGYGAQPTTALAPIFFEVPPEMSNAVIPTHLTLLIALAGGATTGGFNVYWSPSPTTVPYINLGPQQASSVMGFLSAAYPFGSDPDTVNLLSVNLQPSQGELDAGDSSVPNANLFKNLALIDQEVISYAYTNLTGPNLYSFENSVGAIYNRRGVFGSNETNHAINAPFTIIGDGNQFSMPYAPSDIGSTWWFKFPSFNQAGQQAQNLSAATAYPWTLTAPYVRGPHPWKPGSSNWFFGQTQRSFSISGIQGTMGQQFVTIVGQPVANVLSPLATAPKIDPVAVTTALSGNSMPVGSFVAQVFGYDSSRIPTVGSNLVDITIASAASQVSFNTSFSTNTVTYEVFVGSNYDSMTGLGPVTGAPSSITLTSTTGSFGTNPYPGFYGPPDPRAFAYHARAKIITGGGIGMTTVVSAPTSGTLVVQIPSAPLTNEFVGRYVMLIGDTTFTATPRTLSFKITANDNNNPCTLTVGGFGADPVPKGEIILISTIATTSTGTSIGDSGLLNPFNSGTGLLPQVGNTVRVYYDPTGVGNGATATVLSNTSTVAQTTQFKNYQGSNVTPGIGSVFDFEQPSWTVNPGATSAQANPNQPDYSLVFPNVVASLPADQLQGQIILVEVLVQDSSGVDSVESTDALQLVYITASNFIGNLGYYTIPIVAGNAVIDLANGLTQRIVGITSTNTSVPVPIFTGGTIASGLTLTLLYDQPSGGSAPVLEFSTLSGGFDLTVGLWQISQVIFTRTTYQFKNINGTWTLQSTPPITGGPVT